MLLFLSYSVTMYKVNPSDVILVHDDLDRPLGKYSLINMEEVLGEPCYTKHYMYLQH